MQVAQYFEVGDGLVDKSGFLRRKKAQTYQLIDTKEMLHNNELYYLYFRHLGGDSEENNSLVRGSLDGSVKGEEQHNTHEVSVSSCAMWEKWSITRSSWSPTLNRKQKL